MLMLSSTARLEQWRYLGLREFRRHVIEKRHVRERDPAALRSWIDVEMLMLDAAWLDRQQQQIPGRPVDPLPVDDRITRADDHIDDEPALVAVLAGLRLEIVREYPPVLQGGVLMNLRIEVIHQTALPRQEELPVGRLHHDLSGLLPFQKFPPAADENFVGRLGDRAPLALARSLHFGHRFNSFIRRAPSACGRATAPTDGSRSRGRLRWRRTGWARRRETPRASADRC